MGIETSTREVIAGRLWEGRNWSSDQKGSIHDDATAARLGFRGGTVAGSIHMDQFVPVLLDLYGPAWLERGHLSLYFIHATTDRERVRVSAEKPEGVGPVRVWMHRDDDTPVSAGTAGLGNPSGSELRTRDLRPTDPSELRILAGLRPGMSLGEHDHHLDSRDQLAKLDRDLISDPIDWYRGDSPWGGAVATPSTLVQLLWGVPIAGMRGRLGRSVGLFGAIEIAHVAGPVLLDRRYRVSGRVVALSQSPKTEVLWFDSEARNETGALVATHRMMLRFMKASSPLYAAGATATA